MTVPTSDNREQYQGNDSATEFDYAFKVFRADDLVVVLTAIDGTETTLARGTDYSVDGVGNEAGGTVTYPLGGDPLATGEILTILREIPAVQETDLRNQGAYYPETIEDELDRSRMIDQQQQEQLDRTLSRTRASEFFDARGRRIANVGDATEDQDAYTKGQADARFASDVITKLAGHWSGKGLQARNFSVRADVRDGDLLNYRFIKDYIGGLTSGFEDTSLVLGNVQQMKDNTTLVLGQKVRLQGHDAAGDGGGNDYEIVGAGTGTDDGGMYIDLPGSGHQAKGLFPNGVNLKQYGAPLDGVGNDAPAALAALAHHQKIRVTGAANLAPTTLSDAGELMDGIDRLWFEEISVVSLPAGETPLSGRLELKNPTLGYLRITGVDTASVTATAISNVTGSAKDFAVDYDLDDASSISVGDYALVRNSDGTGDHQAVNGCFKVTAKSGNTITVKHTLNHAWPTLTLTSANVWPLKSILRWPSETVGMAISGNLRELSNLVVAGAYNVSTTAPSDDPVDGLQVGTAPNTPETGLNESHRQPAGSLWASRIGVVEWDGNGVQVISANVYMVAASSCSNGWRGFQAGGSGSLSVKSSSAIGNGASGYESEGNSFTNANDSISAGNHQQGFYGIGATSVSAINSFALLNVTHGYDSRNGATLLADGVTAKRNDLNGVNVFDAKIVIGASAGVFDNGNKDVLVGEGGSVNGTGASSLGTVSVDYDSGAILINESGDKLPVQRWDAFPAAPVFTNVTVTTDNSTGSYCQIGNIVFWKIRMDYSGLDTSDLSAVVIDNLPVSMQGRNGGCRMNVLSSTGIAMAASDTFSADYNAGTDSVVLPDAAGTLMKYNGGQIQSSGVIELSGWYEA